MKCRPKGLWKDADFVKVWVGHTISNFGSGITGIALPLTAVLVLSASPAQMGLLSALSGISVVLFGLVAGVWVDRLRRRPILITTDLGRAILLGSLPVAAWFGILQLPQVYVVAALTGVLTVFFDVADGAYLPSLIPQEQLVEANSKLGMSDALAEIGGPGIAGSLVQFVGAPMAIVFDALSFLLSALSIGRIRTVEPEPLQVKERRSAWRESIEGLRVIRENAVLRAMTFSAALFNFFGNFIGTLYILYIVREVRASPLIIGFLVAAGGVSALVGTFIAQRVIQRMGLGLAIGGMLFFYGFTGLLIPLAHAPHVQVVVAVALLFTSQLLGDASVAIYFIAEVSLRQAIIPRAFLGRVNASMQFLTLGVGPGGAILAGILGTILGLQLTILIGVLGVMLAGAWLLFSPVRKVCAI
jgi:predicted MFS family arabinose efflux permease